MARIPPGYRRIDGSERKIARGAQLVGPADPDETFSVTIYVRRNPQAPPLLDMAHWMKTPPGKRKFLSREEFAAQYGAAQPDVDKVTKFGKSHGLKVLETSLPKRSVSVSGTVKQMNEAFGVTLGYYESGKEKYRSREGYVHIPEELGDVVKDVFGLDNRPMPHRPHNEPGTQVMNPPWVAQLYNFPTTGANNQTIGLIELWGGFAQDDINDYYGKGSHGPNWSPLSNQNTPVPFQNLNPPTPVVPLVQNGPFSGGNNPGVSKPADAEVMLDICVASSVAQDTAGGNAAKIAVYFAPHSGVGNAPTASDWAATFLTAVNDAQNTPSVISFTWGGGAEDLWWTAAHMNLVDEAFQSAAMMGVTVLVASGDAGSDDGANDGSAHVDFPASDPWVTSCGGTIISHVMGASFQENTWNETVPLPSGDNIYGATGGGVSSIFPLPDYQANLNPLPLSANAGGGIGRGVPDVSGNASLYAGYAIVLWQQDPFPLPTDNSLTITFANGGTSVVAPLYAALVAILNASLGANIGFLNPTLYSNSGTFVFNYIGDGGNNENPNPTEKSAPSYTSGSAPGQVWNACCGLGSINGINLLNAIVSSNTIVTKNFYFVVNKNTFGLDEVIDNTTWPNAFWLVLEGFAPNPVINSLTSSNPGFSPFFSGVTISMNVSGPVLELPNYTSTPQRILIPYDITFPAVSLASPSPFPAAGGAPVSDRLVASIGVQGQGIHFASTVFELVAGEDPYFANIGPQNNIWWLSQDLRVFTVTPGYNASPINGTSSPLTPPTFNTGSPTSLDTAAAFNFIQALIVYLNGNYSAPSPSGSPDPLDSVLPSQAGALTGDSSVTPISPNPNDQTSPFYNYNFAIARVRLNAAPSAGGLTAQNVRVFFRLLLTMSDGTDYQPNTTYLSAPDSNTYPGSPQADPNNDTVPFFATGYYISSGATYQLETDYGAAPDYAANSTATPATANNRNISVPAAGGSVWQYYGCFLDVYDPNYTVNPVTGVMGTSVENFLAGTHHCLVAQIAYDEAPILSTASFTPTPASSDKLAQRNLQITASGNPGPPPTHRVPQTFDTRPSHPTASLVGDLLNYPDELMIQWGNTPQNSTASIYWPGVDSTEVLKLADKLYTTHQLSASDSHTIQCKTTSGATYVPIPPGTGQSFAGLFTVDLPSGITYGQEFNIVVHRISTRRTPIDQPSRVAGAQSKFVSDPTTLRNWRCILGSFQVRIPVSAEEALLGPEEQTLSIMKWRLQSMLPTKRWYPVLQRYVSYLSARVSGMGGNPSQVLPWQPGTPSAGGGAYPRAQHEYTGKVSGLIYDRFGDFRGFLLRTEGGHEITFRSRESEIEGLVRDSWVDRTLISVFASEHGERWVERIILRRTPKRIQP